MEEGQNCLLNDSTLIELIMVLMFFRINKKIVKSEIALILLRLLLCK